MEIVYLDIDSIKPYENNAKKHPREQIEQIKRSIEEFGNCDPIGIWHDTIVEGHGRAIALKELGFTQIPCIRLDHLTDDQRKAYTLVHNQLTMNTDWEIDLLNMELEDIELDMEEFGFELFDEETEREKNKEETQRRVENILNLEHSQFDGDGKYDIPMMEPVYELPEIDEWIGFNYVLSDNDPTGKGVHFFIDDYQFERVWNNPEKYVDKLKQYACVVAPDFSPYGDMPLATQIFNHYRKHWVACYFQQHGVTVIPCVRASADERSLEFYLDGTPKNSIVCISNMWSNDDESKAYFMKEYDRMYEELKPLKVFVYGKPMELKGDTEFIRTFADKRWNNGEGN